jgi:glycosyltransferase involved in cell wall biosynthesis
MVGMRVGVNLLWLVPGDVGGSEDYAVGFVRALAKVDGLDLVVFCQAGLPEAHPDLEGIASVVVGPSRGDVRCVRLLWESSWLPYQVRRHDLDLLHHLGGTVPPVGGGPTVPTVLTLYDLQPLVHPERFSSVKRVWLRRILPRSVHRADAVLTLSEHVRNQVIELLATPPDQVLAAPPGVPDRLQQGPEAAAAIRRRYGLDGELLLYPAISYTHKNHEVLLDALPAVRERHPTATLVCTGRPGPNDEALDAQAQRLGLGDAVRRLGRVPRQELDTLFGAATALVFPSTYEGFGLPLLEAMAHGLPIVAARASAIPEVVGTSGILVDAHDPTAWAEALDRVLGNPTEWAALSKASIEGASRFGWHKSTPAVVDLYARLTGNLPAEVA